MFHYELGDENTDAIERYGSGFIVVGNGYHDWIPDARINRARFELK